MATEDGIGRAHRIGRLVAVLLLAGVLLGGSTVLTPGGRTGSLAPVRSEPNSGPGPSPVAVRPAVGGESSRWSSDRPAVGLQATATAAPTVTTPYSTVNFSGAAQGGTPPYRYEWNFGDLNPYGQYDTSDLASPQFSNYESAGNYTAVLVVVDAAGASADALAPVGVDQGYAGASVVASASSVSGNVPLTVDFQATASGFYATPSYSWTFGDGQSGSGRTVTHTFTTIGVFDVGEQSGDLFGDFAQFQITIVVGPAHLAVRTSSAPSPASGRAPLPVNLTANVSGWLPPYNVTWTFGDGSSTSYGPYGNHSYRAAGTFTAKAEVTDAVGETVSADLTVTVSAPPQLTVKATSNATQGTAPLSVRFGATPSGGIAPYTESWTFGDGQTGTGTGPSHTYATAGTYAVEVTVKDSVGASAVGHLSISVAGPSGSASSPSAGLLGSPYVWGAVVGVLVIAAAAVLLSRRRRPPAAEPPPVEELSGTDETAP